jgi:hypothetical protein
MYNLILYIAIPALLVSVVLGWWAQKKPVNVAYKVQVGQAMIDSLIITILLMSYFNGKNYMFLGAAAFYSAITSVRLREMFGRIDNELSKK